MIIRAIHGDDGKKYNIMNNISYHSNYHAILIPTDIDLSK